MWALYDEVRRGWAGGAGSEARDSALSAVALASIAGGPRRAGRCQDLLSLRLFADLCEWRTELCAVETLRSFDTMLQGLPCARLALFARRCASAVL